MNTSAAIADPLLRRAVGRRARPSPPHRTARVRIGSSRLRTPVSRRGRTRTAPLGERIGRRNRYSWI